MNCKERLCPFFALIAAMVIAVGAPAQALKLTDPEQLGRQAMLTGNYLEAGRDFAVALERAEGAKVTETHLVVALGNLGEALRSNGDYDEAERVFTRAILIVRNSTTADNEHLISILMDLGRLYQETGRYILSESLLEEALQRTEHDLGPRHSLMVQVLNGLGLLYASISKGTQAESSFKKAIAIGETDFGKQAPDLAPVLGDLALFYLSASGNYEDAKLLYAESLQMEEKNFGPRSPEVATTLENFSKLLHRVKRHQEALDMEARAKSIRTEAALVVKSGNTRTSLPAGVRVN